MIKEVGNLQKLLSDNEMGQSFLFCHVFMTVYYEHFISLALIVLTSLRESNSLKALSSGKRVASDLKGVIFSCATYPSDTISIRYIPISS